MSEPPATPLSGRGGANTGRREEGPRRAGPRLKRVWAAAAPQCDCVGGLRWPRWRQPIPLTTIRQDYNWDYRLLILNASLCSLINPKGLSTISLRCSPGVPPSVLLLKSFLLPLLLSRVGGREGTLGQGRLAFRKIPFPLSPSLPVSPHTKFEIRNRHLNILPHFLTLWIKTNEQFPTCSGP